MSLVDKPFGSKNDRIFCSNCYDQAFATRCSQCNEIFRAGMKKMEYKGKYVVERGNPHLYLKTPCFTDNGMRDASVVRFAKSPSEPKVSYPKMMMFSVPIVMRTSLQLVVPSVPK